MKRSLRSLPLGRAAASLSVALVFALSPAHAVPDTIAPDVFKTAYTPICEKQNHTAAYCACLVGVFSEQLSPVGLTVFYYSFTDRSRAHAIVQNIARQDPKKAQAYRQRLIAVSRIAGSKCEEDKSDPKPQQ